MPGLSMYPVPQAPLPARPQQRGSHDRHKGKKTACPWPERSRTHITGPERQTQTGDAQGTRKAQTFRPALMTQGEIMFNELDHFQQINDQLAGLRAQAALEAAVRRGRPQQSVVRQLRASLAATVRHLSAWLDPETVRAAAPFSGVDRRRHSRRSHGTQTI